MYKKIVVIILMSTIVFILGFTTGQSAYTKKRGASAREHLIQKEVLDQMLSFKAYI